MTYIDKNLSKCSCGGSAVVQIDYMLSGKHLKRIYCIICKKSTEYEKIGAEEIWEHLVAKETKSHYNNGLKTAIALVEESSISEKDKQTLIAGLESSKKC